MLYRLQYPGGNPFYPTRDEYNDGLFQWVNGEWVDIRIVPVEIDYEALATRIQEDDDMAGHIIVKHSEYVKLARSYAETLGIGGDDDSSG
jgi:hypothetical protein